MTLGKAASFGHRSKNGKPITTPLTDEASAILAALHRNNGVYVFLTTGGHRPIGNFSRIKDKLVDKSGEVDWTYHDFRRTFATHLSEIGYERFDVSNALNHQDNTVTGIYDRSTYFSKKLKMLSSWVNVFQIAKSLNQPKKDAKLCIYATATLTSRTLLLLLNKGLGVIYVG